MTTTKWIVEALELHGKAKEDVDALRAELDFLKAATGKWIVETNELHGMDKDVVDFLKSRVNL